MFSAFFWHYRNFKTVWIHELLYSNEFGILVITPDFETFRTYIMCKISDVYISPGLLNQFSIYRIQLSNTKKGKKKEYHLCDDEKLLRCADKNLCELSISEFFA